MSVAILAIFGWAGWAMGWLPMFGGGFAGADDVRDIRAVQIEEKIDTVTKTLCSSSFDPQLLEYRNSLQREHRVVTGHDHESPSCEILLKLKR